MLIDDEKKAKRSKIAVTIMLTFVCICVINQLLGCVDNTQPSTSASNYETVDDNIVIDESPNFEEERAREEQNRASQEALEQAIMAFTEEIRKNPNNADLYFRRGYAYAFMRVLPENWTFIPSDELGEEILSMFTSGTEDWDKAISDWETACRIDPSHSDAKNYLVRFRNKWDFLEKEE
jgi:tetratricopeptide (TPR) repeat protein